ncbi:MAG: heme A synthase [Rhodoferax sp.]|nr:heme A synthase [Rhodoferax sp.]
MQDLYDWSPALRLMALGLLLALGPLVWVWRRHRQGGLLGMRRALTLLTLFLTFDLVMFGAFTRLTDSGLGCPDWPGCYGHASPIGAHAPIAQAQAALPSGPVTHGKAWIEMVHRYLATGVGVLIIGLLVLAWRQRVAGPHPAADTPAPGLGLPLFTLVWVCLQGAFGALTVTWKLFPAIVTLHLLGGLMLLALLVWQAVGLSLAGPDAARPPALPSRWRALALLTTAALMVQVTLGGWVSTNYAVLACSDMPLCQGRWWPEMDFAQGFQVWRELGLNTAGEVLTLAALTAIHFVHRWVALPVLLLLAALAHGLIRTPGWRRAGRSLAGLAALQLLTGLSNVVLGWPLLAAVLHTGGAAALLGLLVAVVAASRSAPALAAGVDAGANGRVDVGVGERRAAGRLRGSDRLESA